jgi:HK97 family phage prohead protease
VKEEADGSFTTIGCHESKQDAVDQMVAVSLSEDMDPLGDVGRSIRQDSFEPTDAMKEEAQRGLDWRQEFGRGGTAVGVARARDIVNGRPLSLDTIQRMASYFARHEIDKQGQGWSADEDGFPSAGRIAWALWGGDAGRSWAEAILAEEMPDRADLLMEEDPEDLMPEEQMPEAEDEPKVKIELEISVRKDEPKSISWVPKSVSDRRAIAYSNIEARADGDGLTLIGYAAVWDSPSEPLPWIEYVKRGAFSKTLNDGADVRLLIDHEGVPLARTKSGTLRLSEDEKGLRTEATLDPANPDAARLISALGRGDISQMSFAFRVVKDSWSADRQTRELREVQLFDVSVVTFPAYEETVAELRGRNDDVIVRPSIDSILLRKRQIDIARHR